jgi:protein involved in polysaccharide export with SLBB domain
MLLPATRSAQNTVSAETDPNFIDRVHQGDVIDIHIPGYLEFDWRGRINPEGFLDGYDKIAKPVYAQCKSREDLAREIDSILAEILRNPKTEVRIVDRSKRPTAIIDGAVKTPSKLQMRRPARLSEIIVNAGGFTDRASGRIIVSRQPGSSCLGTQNDQKSSRMDIAISDLLAGDVKANPTIVSGDLIVVIEASPVYLLGAVQTQGRIDFRPDLTVSRAIDSAGGLEKNALRKEVKIFRRDGGASVIAVDLEKARSNQADDVFLRPFDIIDVPLKGKPPRRLPPMDLDAEANEKRLRLPVKIIE